eukprot:scaffold345369_cov38-Prasinocladus_malaysianus.AAC.1
MAIETFLGLEFSTHGELLVDPSLGSELGHGALDGRVVARRLERLLDAASQHRHKVLHVLIGVVVVQAGPLEHLQHQLKHGGHVLFPADRRDLQHDKRHLLQRSHDRTAWADTDRQTASKAADTLLELLRRAHLRAQMPQRDLKQRQIMHVLLRDVRGDVDGQLGVKQPGGRLGVVQHHGRVVQRGAHHRHNALLEARHCGVDLAGVEHRDGRHGFRGVLFGFPRVQCFSLSHHRLQLLGILAINEAVHERVVLRALRG